MATSLLGYGTSGGGGGGGGDIAALFGPISFSDTDAPSLFQNATAPKLFQDAVPGATPSSLLPAPTSVTPQSTVLQPPAGNHTGTSHLASPGTADTATYELTQEELEAYRAPAFVLGKIPIHPPPSNLC